MYLLYCDESNLQERDGDFLVYGGLLVASEQAKSLSRAIDQIRAHAGVDKRFKLKFNPGPENLDHAEFINLKKKLIEAAIEHGAKLVMYFILHNIASSPDEARRNGINTVCYHFDCLLNRFSSSGMVLIDRFSDGG